MFILILKLSKLHVLLHVSTYKLRVNILWYVNNIFSFLDYLFTFSIHLPTLSPRFTYDYSSPVLYYGVNLLSSAECPWFDRVVSCWFLVRLFRCWVLASAVGVFPAGLIECTLGMYLIGCYVNSVLI